MKRFRFLLLSLCFFSGVLRAEQVTFEFEAEAATVVGQPFGFDVPRLTVVRGLFSYDTDTPDERSGDPDRGRFDLSGSWRFRAEFLGHVITGSTQAAASTNLFGHSLSFNDGGDRDNTGDMAFDDVTRNDVSVGLGISGSAEDLLDDQLPEVFRFRRRAPFRFAAHTFSLKDDSGTMLLQLCIVRQWPIVPVILSIDYSPTGAMLKWCSQFEQTYAVDASTDLVNWVVVLPQVAGQLIDTTVTDVFADRLGKGVPPPPDLSYRIRETDPQGEP